MSVKRRVGTGFFCLDKCNVSSKANMSMFYAAMTVISSSGSFDCHLNIKEYSINSSSHSQFPGRNWVIRNRVQLRPQPLFWSTRCLRWEQDPGFGKSGIRYLGTMKGVI